MWKRLFAVSVLCGCGTGEAVIEDGEQPPELSSSPLSLGDPANHALYGLDISMWEGPIAEYEMDCFWSAGVRHIVSGTQVEEVTRQQLAMAQRRGMSLDAYVYLYWTRDPKQQVRDAFARVDGFDLGRMWLDVEDQGQAAALGPNALLELIQQALDECRTHAGVDCGIYTGAGFWNAYLARSTRFADVPLWYARYNDVTSLDSWATEHFGGWVKPVAKQWAERALCGVGPDHDSMQVLKAPALVVDRTPAPAPVAVPPAPSALWPVDQSRTSLETVKLMVDTIPFATAYDFALESWSGTAWQAYATWRTATPFKVVSPVYRDRAFRLRVRAMNSFGWGAWSAYSTFVVGNASPAPTPTPTPAPAPSGPLSPDGGAVFTAGSSVTMSGPAVSGASAYELAVEVGTSSGTYVTYYTYATTSPTKTFWPQSTGAYRWRLRAKVNGSFGAWSAWATFDVK